MGNVQGLGDIGDFGVVIHGPPCTSWPFINFLLTSLSSSILESKQPMKDLATVLEATSTLIYRRACLLLHIFGSLPDDCVVILISLTHHFPLDSLFIFNGEECIVPNHFILT
jgi:hypothetical protein